MKSLIRIPIIIALLFLWSSGALGQDTLQFINPGDYPLENGQVIRGCRVAYRTFGVLNSENPTQYCFPPGLPGQLRI